MTAQDIIEFTAYLDACTDLQVFGVIAKEEKAGRDDYAALAWREALRRGLAP